MEIYKRKDAAHYLRSTFGMRTTTGSLATMASRGGGPLMIKFGKFANYRKCDLIDWAGLRCSGLLESTSTPPNDDTGGLFAVVEDDTELDLDFFDDHDPNFDEVTHIEEMGELDRLIDKAASEHHYFNDEDDSMKH